MSDLEIQLKRVQAKLQQLLKVHTALKKENDELKIELGKAQQQAEKNFQYAEDLKRKIEIIRISSGTWDEKDKKAFEKRINGYIKEIDRCITLLSE